MSSHAQPSIETLIPALISLFDQAGDNDPEIQKPAEAKLHDLERASGFFVSLAMIFTNPECGLATRMAAVLKFKNGLPDMLARFVFVV